MLARGRGEQAVGLLEDAVVLEDALHYDEPRTWHHSTRQILAAALLELGRNAQAQVVLEQDLVSRPENGWALTGLELSLRGQGKNAEASAVAARLAKAWERADVSLDSSRF